MTPQIIKRFFKYSNIFANLKEFKISLKTLSFINKTEYFKFSSIQDHGEFSFFYNASNSTIHFHKFSGLDNPHTNLSLEANWKPCDIYLFYYDDTKLEI
jgi:hypothetical protein